MGLAKYAEDNNEIYLERMYYQREKRQGGWKLKYVTLTNEYSIADLERLISSVLGQKAVMQRLNYDFEIAAQLIYS